MVVGGLVSRSDWEHGLRVSTIKTLEKETHDSAEIPVQKDHLLWNVNKGKDIN